MFKKMCTLLIAFLVTLVLPGSALAVDSSSNYTNYIVQQVLKLDTRIDLDQSKQYKIVDILNSNPTVGSIYNSSSEKAIQIIEENGAMTTITTIIPYKLSPHGELINSFSYVLSMQERSDEPIDVRFVDTTVTVNAYLNKYGDGYITVYQPKGVDAYWYSNYDVSLHNMVVDYDARGALYRYPEYINDRSENDLGLAESAKIWDDYLIDSGFNIDNPVMRHVYSDYDNVLPDNRAIYPTNYFEHGGNLLVEINYTVNGRTYTHDESIWIFSK